MELNGAEIVSFREIRKSISSNNEIAEFVQIPLYQRPYKWGDIDDSGIQGKRISDLITDFFSHLESSQKNKDYFAGSIISVFGNKNGYTEKQQELVDGQQRYTTLYLINFLGYLFTVKKSVYQYKDIAKLFSHSLKEATVKDIVKDNLKKHFSNINLHLNELFNLSIGYQTKIDCFLTKLTESADTEIPIEESDFSIFSISSILQDKHNSLALRYDRPIYNTCLKNVLSSISMDIKNNTIADIAFSEEFKQNSLEKSYALALETITKEFNNRVNINNSFDALIQTFLGLNQIGGNNGIKLCLIQTGNEEDAYTLFEVLNDRSLMLDDLEIIKNKFFRKFYTDNSSSQKSFNNNLIEQMDDQWSNVFARDTPQYLTDRIASFAISYICKESSLKDGNRSLLKPITKKLTTIPRGQYSEDIFKSDFNQFQLVKSLLEELEIPYSKRSKKLYEVFNNSPDSFTKTCYLLYGLGQDRVFSGMVALYLGYLAKNPTKRFVDFKADQHVEKISRILWWVTFASKDWKRPKELADSIFDYATAQHFKLDIIHSNAESFLKNCVGDLKGELASQIATWRYKNANDVIKMRLMFHLIFRYGISSDGKIQDPKKLTHSVLINLNPEIQLDHLEPIRKKELFNHKYYNEADRDDVINAIGNMAPLTSFFNNIKSNTPLEDIVKVLRDGNPHMFFTHTVVDVFNANKVSTQEGHHVSASFFSARTAILKEYLLDIFSYEYKDICSSTH